MKRSRLLSIAHAARTVYWRLYGPITVGVRGVVVDDRGRVLLVRHTYGMDRWYLPGGGVRRREAAIDAVRRELREETGVVMVAGRPDLLGAYTNLEQGKSDHVLVFVVREWTREPSSDREIAAAEFFALDELPANVSPGSRRRLEELAGDRQVSYRW